VLVVVPSCSASQVSPFVRWACPFLGVQVTTMYHLDRPMYLLGYLAAQSRVYLIDKEFQVSLYGPSLSIACITHGLSCPCRSK